MAASQASPRKDYSALRRVQATIDPNTGIVKCPDCGQVVCQITDEGLERTCRCGVMVVISNDQLRLLKLAQIGTGIREGMSGLIRIAELMAM